MREEQRNGEKKRGDGEQVALLKLILPPVDENVVKDLLTALSFTFHTTNTDDNEGRGNKPHSSLLILSNEPIRSKEVGLTLTEMMIL